MKRYDPNSPWHFNSSGMTETPNGDYVLVEDLSVVLNRILKSEEYCESELEEFLYELEEGT